MINTSRRGFLAGVGALLAAPTIVRVASIMPVRPIDPMVDFARLIDLKMKELEAKLAHDIATLTVWGNDAYGNFGSETLLLPGARPSHVAPSKYVWKQISDFVAVTA